VKDRHFVFLIESVWIRPTRPLTNSWLLLILGAAYIISFAFFSRAQSFLTPPETFFIGCTSTNWFPGAGCGLNGAACAPFNDTSFNIRCPAQCSTVILQNPRVVGNETTAFVPLIVGGGDPEETYRGDSFICAAAVQAWVLYLRLNVYSSVFATVD
jgi:hypothetical protein